MILSDKTIKKYIEKGMIYNYLDIRKQLTPNGFDLTLNINKMRILDSRGKIDFSNEKREISSSKALDHKAKRNREFVLLKPDIYLITFNEIFNMPLNVIGRVRSRSSLIRCGAVIHSGVADAGWNGRFQCLLNVLNQHGIIIYRNARVAQIIFEYTDQDVQSPYSGIYQE